MTFYSPGSYPSPQQASVGPHSLSGTVVDAVSGEPIRRAQVQLNGAREDAVLTDASGRFSFEKLPPGMYNLRSARPGYLSFGRSFAVVEVGSNSTGQTVLKLNPVSTIEGTINDFQGEPLEGINVSALESQVVDGRRRWMTRSSAQTDGEGHYRISGLEPGPYIVKTGFRQRYPGWRVGTAGGEGYRGVYFPNVSDRTSATKVELAAGQRASADFELRSETTFRVSGFMQYEGQWAFVNVFDSDGESVQNAAVNPESGRFDIQGLVAGSYQLRGEVITEHGAHSTAVAQVSVGPSRSDVSLAVRPDLSIPIRARLDSGDQTTTAAKNLLQMATGSIRLEDARGGGNYSAMPMMAGTNASGEVSLRSVSPGHYYAQVNWSSPCSIRGDEVTGAAYIASLRSGSVDLLHDPLIVSDGGQPEPIEIVLKEDAAALMVNVANVVPYSEPFLIVVPDGDEREPIVRPLFSLPAANPKEISSAVCGLAPGGYSVAVVKNGNEIEYKNPEALSPLQSKAVHVQLAPNRVTTVQIEGVGSVGD